MPLMIVHKFPVLCQGRDLNYQEAFESPVKVTVTVRRNEDEKSMSITVDCPYNGGAHGQRCKAYLFPGAEIGGRDSMDIPHFPDHIHRMSAAFTEA